MLKKIILVMLVMMMFPAYACADTPGASGEVVGAINVNSGLPVVTEDQVINKANNMTNSLHQLAMKISPQFAILVLMGCAVLGVFLKAARTVAIFVLLGLALIYWAPMIVALWTSFLQ